MAACGSTAPVPLPSERICELWESGFSVHADSILHELHRQDHGVRDEVRVLEFMLLTVHAV